MKERPILFSGPMVRAILEGKKTQTRRVMKPQPVGLPDQPVYCDPVRAGTAEDGTLWTFWTQDHRMVNGAKGSVRNTCHWRCPFGRGGDRLWVRESIYSPHGEGVYYSADDTLHPDANWAWKKNRLPSIHMPWGLRRITLEIVKVRVERVQDISEADATAEGMEWLTDNHLSPLCKNHHPSYDGQGVCTEQGCCECGDYSDVEHFHALWDSINAERGYGWSVNPWVWCVSFKAVTGTGAEGR